jgi:hypothetical protein
MHPSQSPRWHQTVNARLPPKVDIHDVRELTAKLPSLPGETETAAPIERNPVILHVNHPTARSRH